jgi:hypothetical protein
LLRKRDFARDNKKAALRKNVEYKKRSISMYDQLYSTSTATRP